MVDDWSYMKVLHFECDAIALMHTSFHRHNTRCLRQPEKFRYYQQNFCSCKLHTNLAGNKIRYKQ